MQRADFPILPKLDAFFARDRSTQQRRLMIWAAAVFVGAMLWLPPALHTFSSEVPLRQKTLLEDDPFADVFSARNLAGTDPTHEQLKSTGIDRGTEK